MRAAGRWQRRWSVGICCLALGARMTATTHAHAGQPDRLSLRAPAPDALLPPRGAYARLLSGASVGRGLRLNNPFRLSTQLGDSAESLSLTATYLDLDVGATLGDPDGLQHGVSIHGAFALDGVTQEVITPGYLALWQLDARFLVTGRLGLPIVVEPDLNLGYELGLSGVLWLLASFGVRGEIIGSVFQGAGTPTRGSTVVPILSAQIGGVYQYEVLP